MSSKTVTSQVYPGTSVSIGGDGQVSSLAASSAAFDAFLGPAVGGVAIRDVAGWHALAPGLAGQILQTNGGGSPPSWVTPANTITSAAFDTAFGSSVGGLLYRSSGAWQSLAIGTANKVMTSSGTLPAWTTLSAWLDAALANTQGSLIYRNATTWTTLAPGTAGQVLQSGGASANPSWVNGGGAGTVTSVGLSLPAIFSVSGSPVTTAGTLAATLANQNANTFFAGPTSGGAATPAFRAITSADLPTISSLLDGIGSTRGSVLYRGASGWSALTPGTSGYVLTSNGAGADPTWNVAGGGAASPSTWTRTILTAASGTYVTPANCKAIRVRGVGGGGGGGGGAGGSGGSNAGSPGNGTSFGASLVASPGQGGPLAGSGAVSGGGATGGDINIGGQTGGISNGSGIGPIGNCAGGDGGSSMLGQGGRGGWPGIGGLTGSGFGSGGGGGGGSAGSPGYGGGGGSAGGYFEKLIVNPAASYGYSVGNGGAGGLGNYGYTGAVGQPGVIIVDEFY